MESITAMLIALFISAAIQIGLIVLFVKMFFYIRTIKNNTEEIESAAYYIKEGLAYQELEMSAEAKRSFLLAQFFLKENKIGVMPEEVLSEYNIKSDESYSVFLENYIRKQIK